MEKESNSLAQELRELTKQFKRIANVLEQREGIKLPEKRREW